MSQPLVTVITPCYNHAPYLSDYFEGLLSQTHRNVQLLFFDDGSTDDSWEVALRYEERLKAHFTSVSMTTGPNRGFFAVLEAAQRQVEGDYVCILESDDYYLPGKLERTVGFLEGNPDYGAVHTEATYLFSDHTVERYWRSIGREIPVGDVFCALATKQNFIMTCTFCLRRRYFDECARIEEYRIRGYMMADHPLFIDVAARYGIGYIDDPLSVYRYLDESASRSRNHMKRHRFVKSTYAIMVDAIREYGRCNEALESVLLELHLYLFIKGYELRIQSDCRRGYFWILKNCPEYATRGRALRARYVMWRSLVRIARGRFGFGRGE